MADPAAIALLVGGDAAARNVAALRAETAWLAFVRAAPLAREAWLARAAEAVARAGEADVLAPGGASGQLVYDRGVLLVRRELFERVGGYREEFDDAGASGAHADWDLGFRLEAVNARTLAAPELATRAPRVRAATPLAWARSRALDPLLGLRHARCVAARVDVTCIGSLRLRALAVRASGGIVLCALLGAVLLALGRTGAARSVLFAAAALQFALWARWRCAPQALPAALLAPWLALGSLVRGTVRAVNAAGR